MLKLLAAVSLNNVIGRDNTLPWRIPSDLTRFRHITMGATLIMGRRTYESLPAQKLPGRNLIVLTEGGGANVPRIRFIPSLEEALDVTKDDRVFVIGGATVFERALAWADEVLITRVLADVEGDTFFPALPNRFRLMNIPVEMHHSGDEYKTQNEVWSAS